MVIIGAKPCLVPGKILAGVLSADFSRTESFSLFLCG
jgi:hypothetical protein